MNNKTKKVLKIIGPIIIVVGIVLFIIGTSSLFSFDDEFPKLFFLSFIGLPLIAIGGWISMFAFRENLMRFHKNMTIPIAKETLEELAPTIKDLTKNEEQITCPSCGKEIDKNSKFCNHCGNQINQ